MVRLCVWSVWLILTCLRVCVVLMVWFCPQARRSLAHHLSDLHQCYCGGGRTSFDWHERPALLQLRPIESHSVSFSSLIGSSSCPSTRRHSRRRKTRTYMLRMYRNSWPSESRDTHSLSADYSRVRIWVTVWTALHRPQLIADLHYHVQYSIKH